MKKPLFAFILFVSPIIVTPLVPTQTYAAAATGKLGDLSQFESITKETLALINNGDLKGAEKRITAFETAWDDAHGTIRSLNPDEWGVVDDAADRAIASLRASKPTSSKARTAVNALNSALHNASTQ